MAQVTYDQYRTNELKREYAFHASRNKLGDWKDEELITPETCIDRLDWLLCGNYGAGAQFYAEDVIANNLHGKVGKNIDNAWLAIGANLVMLVALHESTEYTFRKITEVWKAQGVDFKAINAMAAKEIQAYIETNKGN